MGDPPSPGRFQVTTRCSYSSNAVRPSTTPGKPAGTTWTDLVWLIPSSVTTETRNQWSTPFRSPSMTTEVAAPTSPPTSSQVAPSSTEYSIRWEMTAEPPSWEGSAQVKFTEPSPRPARRSVGGVGRPGVTLMAVLTGPRPTIVTAATRKLSRAPFANPSTEAVGTAEVPSGTTSQPVSTSRSTT